MVSFLSEASSKRVLQLQEPEDQQQQPEKEKLTNTILFSDHPNNVSFWSKWSLQHFDDWLFNCLQLNRSFLC